MNVVCVGDCGIDEYEGAGDRLAGGITLNFAINARRAFPPEDEITVVTALGTDPAAEIIRRTLALEGIRHDVTTLEGATPVQRIALGADGERRFTGYDAGVLAEFRPSAGSLELIERADWLVTPHFVQVAGLFESLLQYERRGRLAVDFADFREHPDFGLLAGSLDRIDVAFFGLHPDDGTVLAALERVAAGWDGLLVVTLGRSGSRAYRGRRVRHQPAIPVPAVVDTTGAGDAFAAGFLGRHCHGAPPESCLEAGARLASGVIQHLGSRQPR